MFNSEKIYTYIYIKIKVKNLLRKFLSPYMHITYFYGTLSLYIPIAAWRFPKNFQGRDILGTHPHLAMQLLNPVMFCLDY